MKIVVLAILTILIIVAGAFMLMPKGPNPKLYEYLKTPQISEKNNQNMLVVEAKGEASTTAGKAIGLLIKAWFNQDGIKKSFKLPAVRARWPHDINTPKDQWVGYFALPVPDSLQNMKTVKNPNHLKIYLQKWEYGKVAEILHTGPYDTEKQTVDRLKAFIQTEGYQIIGEHEEEYLKGPGMFGKGNPEKYMTIIRYRIVKSDSL
ncbi:MAG TPA: GyrI-like domain-containing protein [Candidatus Cloacimonadota bacterium]|jgi:hypothetical protein|nr:GyrI-like domain-containing protein [Candidatus Cloacimonadota bacterium]